MHLTKVESKHVLGVYIDSHLTWNEHIKILRWKLLQRITTLGRARRYLPTKYRLLLYNASIKPLFTYLICNVWSNCSQTNLDQLFKRSRQHISRIENQWRKIEFFFILPKHPFLWTSFEKTILKFQRFFFRLKFKKVWKFVKLAVFALPKRSNRHATLERCWQR